MFRAPRVLKTQATAPPVGAAVSSSGNGALITCSMVKVGCCGASGAGGRRASEIDATMRRSVFMGQETTPDSGLPPGEDFVPKVGPRPLVNPGLAPGVSVGLSLRRGTFIRELRACARGQWKLCLSVEVPSINPGFAPGVS